jgi:anti-anti-sigma factor
MQKVAAMASPDPLAFTVRDTESALEIHFVETRLGNFNIEAIGEQLLALLPALGQRTLQLDFDKVTFLDSAVLNKVVTLHKQTAASGGRVKVSNLDPSLYEIFFVTRLTSLFEVTSKHGGTALP